MPFTKDGLVHGVLADYQLWHGPVQELPHPEQFIVMLALTNNPYHHPLQDNRYRAPVEKFDIGLGVIAYILQRGLEAFPQDERESRSKQHRSGALYLYSSHHNQHCTLLQVLPPFSVTSCHYHQWITEDFYSLIGSCAIGTMDSLNGKTIAYTPLAQTKLTVPRHVIHQMANTTEKFAVNFLNMRGLARPLKHPTQMDDHHYVEPSPFTFKLFE